MKAKILLLLCLITSAVCMAQFPAPSNFSIQIAYLHIGDSGFCGDKYVIGPTYCTYFQWDAPDLSGTEAQLKGYNIYYYSGNYYDGMEIPFSDAEIIAQTTDTHLQMEIGIIGAVWVTAVYSDPVGESEPSNITGNNNLPITIKKVDTPDISFVYDKQRNDIEISGIENISSFNIYSLAGLVIPIQVTSDFIDTKNMKKGVYIVKVTTKDAKIIMKKIIIE